MITYLRALNQVFMYGKMVETSHGIRTRSLQGVTIRHDVRKGFPLLTTKEMNWRHQVAEVVWYLSGDNHIRNLRRHARYWDAWADENGNLQTAYGRFWRGFPSPMNPQYNHDIVKATKTISEWPNDEIWASQEHPSLAGGLYDQVDSIVRMMKRDPYTRRAVVSAWHPSNAHNSKLPPCHFAWRLSYDGDTLNITVYQRSADMPLGVPYNIAQYSLLLHLLAKDIGLPAGQVVFFLDDCHIYENQLENVRQQLCRVAKPLPQIVVPEGVTALKIGWDNVEDFAIINYDPHPAIKYPITEVGVTKKENNDG